MRLRCRLIGRISYGRTVLGLAGIVAGFFTSTAVTRKKIGSAAVEADKKLAAAEKEAHRLRLKLKRKPTES